MFLFEKNKIEKRFLLFVYLNVGRIFIGYDFQDFFQYMIENQEYYGNYCLPRILHNEQIQLENGLMTLFIATFFIFWLGYSGGL